MTFDELDSYLPNGFHDGEIETISLDYKKQTASLFIKFLVGSPDGEVSQREAMRQGLVTITGLQFFIIDSPCCDLKDGSHLRIDAGSNQPSSSPINLPKIHESKFLFWIFISEWNSFIRIAASDIEFNWI